MRMRSAPPMLLVAAIFSLASCVERSDPTDPSDPNPASTLSGLAMAVQLPVASLEVGHVVSAAARLTGRGAAIPNATVNWLSSDNSVLTVSPSGQVSAEKIGTAWVYATQQGVAGKVALTITDSVPSHVSVSPRSATAVVGAHVQLSAAITTATGRTLADHQVSWTSPDARLVTVSPSGTVVALATGTARIVAQTAGVADTAIMSIAGATPPPPITINGGGSHEPSVMALIQDWSGHNQGAWLSSDGGAIKQKFAYEDRLGDTSMVQTYGPWQVPDGQTWGPGHLYLPIPKSSGRVSSFYMRVQLKLSANWKQPPGMGDQKLFQMFPSDGRGYNVGTILVGGDGDLRLMAYENNQADSRYNGVPLGQNPRGSKYVTPPPDIFTLNTWHTIEVLIVGNTGGAPNGRVLTWLDGKKQTEVDDMMWVSAGQDGSLSEFDLNSLWGGQGGTLPSAQFMYVGKIHLSGTSQLISGSVP